MDKAPLTLVFRVRSQMCFFCIDMGMCEKEEGKAEPWARVRMYGGSTPREVLVEDGAEVHECAEDHILRWEASSKTFSEAGISWALFRVYIISVDLLFVPFLLDSTGGILELKRIGFTFAFPD